MGEIRGRSQVVDRGSSACDSEVHSRLALILYYLLKVPIHIPATAFTIY
jgi:hypothetical protein